MAITHTIEFGTKKKSKRKAKEITKTQEEKECYRQSQKEKIAREKKEFIDHIIEAAKKNEKMPWEMPNFIRFPKRLDELNKIAKHNRENPDHPIPINKAHYRGSNILRLCMAMEERGYTDSRFAGYKQIEQLGGQVRKGEKGIKIWVYKPESILRREYNPETGKKEIVYKKDLETGEFLRDEKGKKIPYKDTSVAQVTVFNVEQADGLHLPPEPPIRVLSAKEECPEMEKIIANSEAPVKLDQTTGLERYYSPMKDEIHLPPKDQFKSMTQFYATAAHEIGHSTGHPRRLNRDMGGYFGSEKYAREEMVAELTSVFLSQELEIKIPQKELDNHAAYLQSWNEKIKVLEKNPEELVKIISDAQKATDYIKGHMLEKDLKKEKEQKKTGKALGIHRKKTAKSMER